MHDLEVSTQGRKPVKGRTPWLRILGLTAIGGVLLFAISLPGLASDDQQARLGAGWYVALVLGIAAVMSCTYVVVRRAVLSKRWALLIAFAVVPASFVVAVLFLLLIVIASS
jgi:drug/metabolite transporter (DMT)-like permease